ncbi:MAG: four helix bundle protein [Acidobacteria bacterium]|nr:four helix bundle protein [Acidobacteriota bacterium]
MVERRSYRDLVVWQRSVDLVPMIYELLRAFPKHEIYGLTDQIRRSSISIAANIAEGQGRQHPKEFLQHLSIARGSLAELHTLLIIAERLRYLETERLACLEEEISQIRRPLPGLMTSLRAKLR